MNIITNKEVFSKENQAKTPKKIERRRSGGRTIGRPRTSAPSYASSTPHQSEAPQLEARQAGASPTPISTPASSPHPDQNNKTVFYQAARPRQSQERPVFPRPERRDEQAIDPRTLIPRGVQPIPPGNHHSPVPQVQPARVAMHPAPLRQAPAPSSPSSPSSPQSGGGRFTTTRRRPGRGQMPQDSTATFISRQPNLDFTPRPLQTTTSTKNVRIIPLGGLEEIGKNMTILEYGDDIIIIDMGFQFPESDMYGVDYVIPDVTYLEDKKDKIRGAIITHGHLDHIGAIPYLVEKLGFPPLYGTPITMGMAKQRLEEFGLAARNQMNVIQPGIDVLQLGAFKVNSFPLQHSVPGAIGLEIETPNGRIAYCTDWKFDYSPSGGQPIDLRTIAAIGARGVDLLFSDSTNAERPGHSVSEKVVDASLTESIESAAGRVIIAMFSSNLNRIQATINIAAKNSRKVLIVGRSIQQNVEMAIGLKALTIPPNTLISEREVNRFNDSQVLILSTGAQGEDRSALTRMASGDHRVIKIKKGDTVIISSSPIPGNERSVSGVMDSLYKAGAHVIYNKMIDIHTTGHANQEDLKLMIALMKPRYFVPLHGERSKLIMHGKLAEEVGVKPEDIIIGDNGLVLEMDPTGRVIPTDNHVPAGYVMVDGLGIGDVGNIVLRDRQAMAQEGIFMIFSIFDGKAHKWLNSPDIISRGFIYMRENEQFVNDIRGEIRKFLTKAIEGQKNVDIAAVRNDLRDFISKLLYEKTERQPMVIPVITEV